MGTLIPESGMTTFRKEMDRLFEAIRATRSAGARGLAPGAGLILARCIAAIEPEESRCDGDERTGVKIPKGATEATPRQIVVSSAPGPGVVIRSGGREAPAAHRGNENGLRESEKVPALH